MNFAMLTQKHIVKHVRLHSPQKIRNSTCGEPLGWSQSGSKTSIFIRSNSTELFGLTLEEAAEARGVMGGATPVQRVFSRRLHRGTPSLGTIPLLEMLGNDVADAISVFGLRPPHTWSAGASPSPKPCTSMIRASSGLLGPRH